MSRPAACSTTWCSLIRPEKSLTQLNHGLSLITIAIPIIILRTYLSRNTIDGTRTHHGLCPLPDLPFLPSHRDLPCRNMILLTVLVVLDIIIIISIVIIIIVRIIALGSSV